MESEPEKTADEMSAPAAETQVPTDQADAKPSAVSDADVADANETSADAAAPAEGQDASDPEASPEGDSAPAETDSAEAAPAAEGEAAVEDPGTDSSASAVGAEAQVPAVNPKFKWYAVHTYSGHENKARLSLLERVKNAEMDEKFGEVLIPTESVVEMVKGQRRTMTRKFYPGYMFVQMDLDDFSFHLVKNTPKITGFLGGNKPVPVKDDEIAGINKQMTEGAAKPKPRISFDEGENIRVTGGPFSNFTGIVEEVRPEKQKLRVLVSIFGRATPVELDFSQVEKTEE
jgi:transcriptional antiterminator NusG